MIARNTWFSRNKLALSIATLSLTPALVLAQEFTLEEIVVTAQKRAQSVNDIGVAVSAFNGDDIRELGLDNATDLAAATPGLSSSNALSEGIPIFSIRGVGLDDFNTNNSGSVGVYVDEVFVTSPAMMSFQMYDVDRVEVLKGPQGTLYGRNTTGGAVNFVGRKPTDEFEAYITADYSRWDRVELTGAVGGELTDNARGRLAINVIEQGDGYQDDPINGDEYGKTEKWSMRAQVAFDINETTDVLLKVHGGQDTSTTAVWQADDTFGYGGPTGITATVAALDGTTPAIPGTSFGYAMATPGKNDEGTQLNSPLHSFASIGGEDKPKRDDEAFGGAVTINTDLGFAGLTSITAYDEYDRDDTQYYSGSAAINQTWFTSEIESFSQEFRLVSNSDSDFTWILGMSYGKDDVETEDTALATGALDALFATDCSFGGLYGIDLASGACLPSTDPGYGDPLASLTTAYSPTALGIPAVGTTQYKQETEAFGLYGHSEWQMNDEFKLTLGLRYTQEERSFDGRTIDGKGQAVGFTNALFAGDYVLASLDDSETEENVSGKIALDWTPNDDWLFYASIATGFKSGVYYGSPVSSPTGLGYVEPEELTAFEVGFKATLLDNTMQLNGAAYHYQYDDKQMLATIQTATGLSPTLANIPESEVDGFELDVTWIPMEGLDLKAGVAYINSKVTKGISNVRGAPVAGGEISEGEELSLSPQWSYNILSRYQWSLSENWEATAQVDYSWQDDTASLVADANGRTDTIKALGARVAMLSADGSWEVALWGKNLENEDAVTYAYTNFVGDRSYSLQVPRSYGLNVTYNW
jgi:iron complex outermembrane recepter protein